MIISITMIAGQWKTTGRKVLGMTTGTLPGIRAAGPKKWDFTTSVSNCSSRSQEWEDQDNHWLVNAFLHSFVGICSNFYHSPWIDEILFFCVIPNNFFSPAYVCIPTLLKKHTIFFRPSKNHHFPTGDRPRSYWRSESYGSNDNDTVSKWLTWVLRHGASEA